MKSLSKLKAEPGLWLTDLPVPEIGPNDVLIKIKKTAICGTDVHIYNWDAWAQSRVPVPLTIGHEFMGEIAAIGSEVKGLKIGDRVSGEGHLTCGHCRQCRAGKRHLCRNTRGIGYDCTGCFAEYLAFPAVNVFVLPDNVSDDTGAFLDPLGNAAHTALSFDLVGEDVLITGAGPVGLMAAAIAKHVGARHVVISDVNDYRLELAQKMGATRTVNVTRETFPAVMHELGMQEGFDVGFEMSGNGQALNDLLAVMNHGGHVALLGIPPDKIAIDWNQVIFKGLILKGIYGREMFETWYKMVSMLQSGLDVANVVTHHYPFTDFEKAFAAMRSEKSGKVILHWE
ncbi:MAG: L-threonine 3-dehydrogenase [Gammaproteobacteria bacterium]